MINTMPIHVLEDIELRLAGVDHRPWDLSGPEAVDMEGRRFIIKGSRKALKKAIQAGVKKAHGHRPAQGEIPDEEIMFDQNTVYASMALFKATSNSSNDMLRFVAHAPDDVETLLREVRQLHIMVAKLSEEREAAVKELQGLKVANSRAEQKITDMRRAWRTLCKEMGTKP